MGCCSDTPDTSDINGAASANAEVVREAMDWYEQSYQEQALLREEALRISRQVAEAQIGQMNRQAAIADDRGCYEEETYRPLEQRVVADSAKFDIEGHASQDAGAAGPQMAAQEAGLQSGANDSQGLGQLAGMGVRLYGSEN